MDNVCNAAQEGRIGDLFITPQKYRNRILASLKPREHEWNGRSYVVVFPTKYCPVGCRHCYFASPKPVAGEMPDGILSVTDLRAVSRFVDDASTQFLQITGGGEPLLELGSVLQLVRAARTARIDINTSGVSLSSNVKAREVIETLFETFRASTNHGVFNFRVSVDEFHLEQIRDKSITAILTWFRRNYARYAQHRFFLKLHTLYGDRAVPRLLEKWAGEISSVQYREKHGLNHPVRVVFEDGATFEVDYAARMLSNPAPDLISGEGVDRAVQRYDLIRSHVSNPGLFIDSDARKGLCLVIHEDGSVEVWNTTPKDRILNIRTHSFAQIRRSVLGDVIQMAVLEKTRVYTDALLDEVNPLAGRRAKAIGSATFFNRRALSEAKDRLYVSIRAIQDYIAEGMADRFDMRMLGPMVTSALRLPKRALADLYHASSHDIVTEHLDDTQVTVEDLVRLHRELTLGHYDIAPRSMVERVSASRRLADPVKRGFLDLIG